MASARAEKLRKKARERKASATKFAKTPSPGMQAAVEKANKGSGSSKQKDSRYQPQTPKAIPNDQRMSSAYPETVPNDQRVSSTFPQDAWTRKPSELANNPNQSVADQGMTTLPGDPNNQPNMSVESMSLAPVSAGFWRGNDLVDPRTGEPVEDYRPQVIMEGASLGGGWTKTGSTYIWTKFGSKAVKAIAKKVKPGAIPSTVGAQNTANLVPLNSKVMKLMDNAFKKVFAPRTVITTDAVTGKVTTKIITESGGLVTASTVKKMLGWLAVATIGSATINLWGDYENAQGFDFQSKASYEDAKWAETPEERAAAIARGDEMFAAAEEAMSYDSMELLNKLVPGWGIYYSAQKDWLPGMKQRQTARKDALTDSQKALVEGTDDVSYYEEAHQRELAEIEATKQSRIETESILLAMRAQADAVGRDNDLAYYDKLYNMQLELEAEKIEQQKEYWTWYYKLSAFMRAESSPSKLDFGLL